MARDDEAPEPRWQQPTAAPSPRLRTDPVAPAAAAERFEVGGELGRGGMGYVVAATDTLLDRAVAIKHALVDDADGLRRFEREAKITAQLEHPSIVAIHDAGRNADGRPYYVMRRVDGEPLADLVASAADPGARLALVPNVLAAVDAAAFAHARGVIHRDIKPWNILVGAYGETLLIDWGLADRVDAPLNDDPTAGTPGYMSPEQARGDALDPRADVYALGATLLHVLTGAPVVDSSATVWLERVIAGEPPPVDRVPPEVPGELVAIVAKAMAASPARRYRDAGELAADLRAFLAGKLVAAHRYTALERALRFVRRHRVAVATAAAALVAIAAIGVVAIQNVLHERDRASAALVDAEAGRRLAAERGDVLLLDRASTLASRSPTRALALLRGLPPTSRNLPRARDIAATAAAHGIARGRAAHAGAVRALALAPDGRRLLSAGDDGSLLIHDLATGASQTIVVGGSRITAAVWTHGGRTATYATDGELAIVDLATRVALVVDPRASVDSLQLGVRDDRVRYRDSERGVLIDRAAEPRSEPVVLARDVRVFAIRGERIVAAGTDTLRIVDPSGERVLWRDARAAHVMSIEISPDGTRAAVASQHGVSEWNLAAGTEARRWDLPSTRAFYAGASLYADNLARSNAIDRLGAARTVEAIPGDWTPAWIARTATGVALVNQSGALWWIDEHGELELGHEEHATRAIAAAPGSPYVALSSSSGDLRWWDLRVLLPRSWVIEQGSQLCAIDAERIYVSTMSAVVAYPRAGGTPRAIARAPLPCTGRADSHLLVRDNANGFFEVIDGATGTVHRVRGEMPSIARDAVFFVAADEEVREVGVAAPRWRAGAPITHLDAGPTAVAVVLADGRLVRIDRATWAIEIAQPSLVIDQIAVEPAGGVWLTGHDRIERWAGGALEPVAIVPDLSHILGFLRDGTAVLALRDGAAGTLSAAGALRRATPPSRRVVLAGRAVATLDVPGGVTLAYLDTGERIARNLRGVNAVVADERGLAVIRGDTGTLLQLYQDPVPADPRRLHAWIETATNAAIAPDRDELSWR